MYKATKRWQPNKYLQQLVTDGIIYFLVYVFLFYTLSITIRKYQELTTWTSVSITEMYFTMLLLWPNLGAQ